MCKAGVCPFGRYSCLAHSICCDVRNYTDSSKQAEPIKKETIKMKHCDNCGSLFKPKSNRAKYCKVCARRIKNKQVSESKHKSRSKVTIRGKI